MSGKRTILAGGTVATDTTILSADVAHTASDVLITAAATNRPANAAAVASAFLYLRANLRRR